MTSTLWTIVGSGFGMYGYLPCIIDSQRSSVFLPENVRAKILGRSELKSFCSKINWTDDYESAFKQVSCVALSVPPESQYEYLHQILNYNSIKYLILEKPLAVCPEKSSKLLDFLVKGNIKYLINYSFWYLSWSHKFYPEFLDRFDRVEINWSFMAHHFKYDKSTWKRYHSAGGGALRFYGIHLIALLARSSYSNVYRSHVYPRGSDSIEKWSAVVSGKGVPDCQIVVDSRFNRDQFTIIGYVGDELHKIVDLDEPFAMEYFPGQDRRVSVIQKLVSSLTGSNSSNLNLVYKNVIELWIAFEKEAGIA